MFRGKLHNRCYYNTVPKNATCCSGIQDSFLYKTSNQHVICDNDMKCQQFQKDLICRPLAPNPAPAGNFGSFDNFFYAFVQVFIMSTSGAFADQMYLYMDAYSEYVFT